MIALNYLHYISFFLVFLLFVGGIFLALKYKKEKPKLFFPILLSVTLISVLLVFLAYVVVNKYTKEVGIYKIKSKRLLSIEKVVYTGIVKNEGKFTVGEAIFEIKLVNGGHKTGKGGGSVYQPSSFFGLFDGGGAGILYKPQSIIKRFVVAKNLKAGRSKSFRVYFKYPPYFKDVAIFTKAEAK